jgi:GxxExxY protein
MNNSENKNYKYSDLTEIIIQEAYYVFNKLGFGFLEKLYENALFKRLNKLNLKVERQLPISVYFDDEIVGEYVADLIVERKILVELKSVKEIIDIHEMQLVNYLKATGIEVGLLINFGSKIQIKRKVLSKDFYKNLRL